jgi:predicted Zn-dependent peptidase
MLSGGRSCMHDHRLLGVEDMYSKIEKITSNDLLHVANEIFDPAQVSSLTYTAS